MSLKFIVIQIWVTKDDFLEGLHRSPVRTGRDASVDKALVIQIFVRQVECGTRPEFKFGSWVDANAVTIKEVSVIAQVFVEGIDAEGRGVARVEVAVYLDRHFTE